MDQVEADIEFIIDGRDLVMGDWLLDGIQTLSQLEWILEVGTFWVQFSWVHGRKHRISKAAVVGVLDLDDCLLLGDEVC